MHAWYPAAFRLSKPGRAVEPALVAGYTAGGAETLQPA